MKVAKLAALVVVLMTVSVIVNAAPPGGGSSGSGAPIDGGATLFLGALAAFAYKKLKGKSE